MKWDELFENNRNAFEVFVDKCRASLIEELTEEIWTGKPANYNGHHKEFVKRPIKDDQNGIVNPRIVDFKSNTSVPRKYPVWVGKINCRVHDIEEENNDSFLNLEILDDSFENICVVNGVQKYYRMKNRLYWKHEENGEVYYYIDKDRYNLHQGDIIEVLIALLKSEDKDTYDEIDDSEEIVLYQPVLVESSFTGISDKMKDYNFKSDILLKGFITAYETNQIIILHGTPGSGKTYFTREIAEALDAEYRIISVRPNWIDNQDLMGFYNPIDMMYYPTEFLDVLIEANANPCKKYIICLDEMNLAYIEQYFSDILSAMEDKDRKIKLYSKDEYDRIGKYLDSMSEILPGEEDLKLLTNVMEKVTMAEKIFRLQMLKQNHERYPDKINLSKNIQFVGTLNMDATTKELSPKVIDRSYLIDFDIKVQLGDNSNIILDYSFFKNDKMFEQLNKQFNISLSKRMEKQIEEILKKCKKHQLCQEAAAELIILGKILPQIKSNLAYNNIEDDTIKPNIGSLIGMNGSYPYEAVKEKIKAMYNEENSDEKSGSINYWRLD